MKLNHKGYDGAVADANAFLIYQDDNGVSNVNVRFVGEDVWLAAEQLQQLFQASQQNVHHHIQQIYVDGELLAEATNKKYLLVRNEGKRSVKRNILHYNLDMILAIGMRIRSDVAVRFRQLAIRHLAPVDANMPMVGMTHFEGKYITEDDVKIAKNYLNDKELHDDLESPK